MSKESSVTHPVFKNYVDFEILMSFLKYVFFFIPSEIWITHFGVPSIFQKAFYVFIWGH